VDADSNFFAAYKISASGIDNNPVFSPSKKSIPPPNNYSLSREIKVSPDGKKLACLYNNTDTIEICDFNPESGEVHSKFLLRPKIGTVWIGPPIEQVEYSIDSKLLYLTGHPGNVNTIYQYDATLEDSAQFAQSILSVGVSGSQEHSAIQMGPDFKIYGTRDDLDSLWVINYPSVRGIGCGFQNNVFGLESNPFHQDGLPQFVQRYKAYAHYNGSCQYTDITFTADIWPPPDSLAWDFGDPASGSLNISNSLPAVHVFNLPGDYTVRLLVRHIDMRYDTSWIQLHVNPTYLPQLGPDQTICLGDSATFDAGACPGCTYVWLDLFADTIVSTTQTFTTGIPGTYWVKVINSFGCKGYDTIQLLTMAPPVVTTSPLNKAICSADSTRIALSANVAGATFSWSAIGSTPLVTGFSAGTGDTINQKLVSTSAADETVTYWITPHAGNCDGDSVAYVVTVQPGDSVTVSVAASQNPVCAGTSVTFTATPVNGGTTPAYQWKVNGVNVGANNPLFTYAPINGDAVSCELLSSQTVCVTNNPATSNTITMTVNPNNPVSVSIVASQNPVCAGTSVTLTATPVNGGTAPVFQWYVNGISVGTNSPVFNYVPTNLDLVTCVLLSSETTCVTNNPATSNTITMTVNPNNPVSVSIVASQDTVCQGTSVIFTATPINGGTTPVFQWYVNGISAGTNSPVFTYVPLNGEAVSCELLSSETICVTNNPATSNTITMTVNPNLPVSVSIAASQNPVCSGTSVTFTATPINGGIAPVYQWYINGISVGTNSPVFIYVPVNSEAVSCELLSSETVCVTNNPATSNTITMTVNPNLPVSVSIAASANPVCEGTPVTFTATPFNGGVTPVYQWKVNGVNVGTNNPIYTYDPVSSDLVSCMLTSNLICTTGNPATSNPIVMNVVMKPVVSFTACFDTITAVNAKPIKLKGGIPLGGIYSGTGVNTGIFYPAIAGVGTHIITYSYINAGSCSSSDQISIINYPLSIVNCGSPMIDRRDNKVYPTIQIGTQCWLAANLNYGNPVPSAQYQMDNCIPEKYCYNDLPANCQLPTANSSYQWDELMAYDATPGNEGLCPPAWHVPTESDWNTLFAVYINNAFAGSPLKYSGYSGFNALLTGAKHFNKAWNYDGFAAFFWSSTPWGGDKAWAHGMNDPDPSVSRYPSYRTNAFSVRCLKD
jgi:uncharacterized protein (TIGR02145 family)